MKLFFTFLLMLAVLLGFFTAVALIMRSFVRLAEAPLREIEQQCEARSRSFLAFLAKVRFYAFARLH